MAVEWRKELELGVPEIDQQHQELFRRFNKLLEACNCGRGKEEVLKLLTFLGEYIVTHFQAEEQLQRQVKFPGYEAHRTQHMELIRELQKMEKEYRLEGATTGLVIKMNQVLVSWLIQHISKKDRELAQFIHS